MVIIHVDRGLRGADLVDALSHAATGMNLEVKIEFSAETSTEGEQRNYAHIHLLEHYFFRLRLREVGYASIPLNEKEGGLKVLFTVRENLDDSRHRELSNNIYAYLSLKGYHQVANGDGQSR